MAKLFRNPIWWPEFSNYFEDRRGKFGEAVDNCRKFADENNFEAPTWREDRMDEDLAHQILNQGGVVRRWGA